MCIRAKITKHTGMIYYTDEEQNREEEAAMTQESN
jgi:hypothetical protein